MSIFEAMAMSREQYLAQLPRKVAAAGAFVTDSEGRVLLVKPTYKQDWEVPGGCVEAGESARDACVRELLEEVGLEIGIGTLLVVEHQTAPDDKGDSIMFVYDGGVVAETDSLSLELSGEELSAARFVPIDEIGGFLPERQARRLAAAADARSQNRVIEMVNGHRSQP